MVYVHIVDELGVRLCPATQRVPVSFRVLAQSEEQQLCRALGLERQPGSNGIRVVAAKPGSFVAEWGVEAGSDIVEVRVLLQA